MQPLPRTHPELEIISNLPSSIEYRVHNYKLAKNGTNHLRRGFGYFKRDIYILFIIGYTWFRLQASWWTIVVVLLFLRVKTTQLFWESVVVLPGLGVQVESTRGVVVPVTGRKIALSTSRKFFHSTEVHDVLINEGLHIWDWYYYLAVLCSSSTGPEAQSNRPYKLSVTVAFENILPPLEIVREIYHGIRENLFDEHEDSDPSDPRKDLRSQQLR